MTFLLSKKAYVLAVVTACLFACTDKPQSNQSQAIGSENIESPPDRVFKAPHLEQIPLEFEGIGEIIFGAMGQDTQGNLYFGLSTYDKRSDEAFILSLDPRTSATQKHNTTLNALQKESLLAESSSQNRLQSQIVLADDGFFYFSSSDSAKRGRDNYPENGGHLWRKLPRSDTWEHILKTEEGLGQVHTQGRFVYVLGYWGHTLYQYDTQTQLTVELPVGSIIGHQTQEFIVAQNGRVFVPRVEKTDKNIARAVLVELNDQMAITDLHPMDDYWNSNSKENRGITAWLEMRNGDIYFTLASGGFYRIEETATGRNTLEYLGKFDPQSKHPHMFSLYSPDEESILVALGKDENQDTLAWYIHELSTATTVTYPIDGMPKEQYLFFGAMKSTLNDSYYIVGGRKPPKHSFRPIVLKASYPDLSDKK